MTLALLLLACTAGAPNGGATDGGATDGGATDGGASTDAELARKVLLIGLDGVRPDAIVAADSPTFDRLLAEGAGTLSASTQLTGPTNSGAGWTSVMTGVEVEDHGVDTNGDYDSLDGTWPTIVARAAQHGHTTASGVHWPDINTGILETDQLAAATVASDDAVTDWMVDHLQHGAFDLHVVHFDDSDAAGHAGGFSVDNPDYVGSVAAHDGRISRLLAALDTRPDRAAEQWTVIVTTDHGGNTDGHGAQDADNQTIPFMVWGDATSPEDLVGASHMDTAPTALAALGIPVDPAWDLDGATRGLPPP